MTAFGPLEGAVAAAHRNGRAQAAQAGDTYRVTFTHATIQGFQALLQRATDREGLGLRGSDCPGDASFAAQGSKARVLSKMCR